MKPAIGMRALSFALVGALSFLAADKLQVESETTIGARVDGVYSPDMKRVAIGKGPTFIIRSLETHEEKRVQLDGPSGFVWTWSPDGRFLYYVREAAD